MKSFKIIFFVLSIITIVGCQKEPTANFTTDKETYTAGETIHFTDASSDGHSWKWTMPDGSVYTTQNLDYTISTLDAGGSETFTLEVASKNGKKTSTVSKSITIYPYSYFSITSGSPIIAESITSALDSNNWLIRARGPYVFPWGYVCDIYLPNTPPTSGTYSLDSSNTSLTTGHACIIITLWNYDMGDWIRWTSTNSTGPLNITITSELKVHVVFYNMDAKKKKEYPPQDTTTYKISGDITCH